MKPGNIIEYIDQQKILSAVILKTEDSRASLLNESNHEVNLSFHRILHAGDHSLDLSLSRDRMLANLLQSVHRQIALSKEIDIQALWEILHESPEWIDVPQVARLCFPENATGVHESA
ncbi:MAG: exoribonuclease II, partial [Proteobacteria bacterium]|nr:exoribonuclease II [Pseudomonadota bacterium]